MATRGVRVDDAELPAALHQCIQVFDGATILYLGIRTLLFDVERLDTMARRTRNRLARLVMARSKSASAKAPPKIADDPVKNFQLVAIMAHLPFILLVNLDLPVRSVAETP